MLKRTMRLMSCGESLLFSQPKTFDFLLLLTTDDYNRVSVPCHRCILLTHSPKLAQLIKNDNYFSLEIKLQPGFILAFLELVRYMYLKEPARITQTEKVLRLCSFLEMSNDHFLVRSRAIPELSELESC